MKQHSLLTIGLVVFKEQKIIDSKEIWIAKDEYVTDPVSMKINKINLKSLRENGVSELEAIQVIEKFCQTYFGSDRVISWS